MGINGFIGPISFAADLDLDGAQEIVAGNTLYNGDGDILWEISYGNEGSGCKSGGPPCDGFNAVGNFDADPEGEIVTVRNGVVYLFEHDGTKKAMRNLPKKGCANNEGGPPTVADFDNDGEAEIGVAGADYYFVVDWECCTDLLDCTAMPAGKESECEEPGIRWKVENDDCTSRVTGSSVFDFEGDGAAEVVYNDEEFFRIFDGETGALLLEVANKSHTAGISRDCGCGPGRECRNRVCGEQDDLRGFRCGTTRQIWVHKRSEDRCAHLLPGRWAFGHQELSSKSQYIPTKSADFDPFLAPDLFVEWSEPVYDGCPESLILEGKVCNGGLLWTTGVDVRIYTEDGSLIDCQDGIQMDKTLEPGECSSLSCIVTEPSVLSNPAKLGLCVDGFDSTCVGPGFTNECNEKTTWIFPVSGRAPNRAFDDQETTIGAEDFLETLSCVFLDESLPTPKSESMHIWQLGIPVAKQRANGVIRPHRLG